MSHKVLVIHIGPDGNRKAWTDKFDGYSPACGAISEYLNRTYSWAGFYDVDVPKRDIENGVEYDLTDLPPGCRFELYKVKV